ncbi:MAG: hypothetical protein ACI84K_001042 [Pseudohongiellaceae bacterium]|jgi:hypothetical protein
MKNITINTLTNASLALIIYYTASSSAASEEIVVDIYSSGFYGCFSDGYNASELSKDQIYITAECFTALLEKEELETASLGASKLTIMQYSDSWYRAAAAKGHDQAQAKIKANLAFMVSLEQRTHFGMAPHELQLFASENAFKALDSDRNGFISLAEASVSKKITADFAKSDYDKDDMLSPGEYTIQFGEMTSAGN